MFRTFMTQKTALVVALVFSVAVGSVLLTGSVVAQDTPTVEEDEISVDGSTITISTAGSAAVSVTELPEESVVDDISGVGAETDEGILWSNIAGLPETVSFTLTPPAEYEDGDELTFVVGEDTVSLTVVSDDADDDVDESSPVQEDNVSVTGSTVTVDSEGLAALSVSDLPAGSEVADISAGGAETDEGVLWNDLSGLPDTVSFTLTPPADVDPGEEIVFDVGESTVALTVVESDLSDNVPDDLPDAVSDEQYLAVAGDDGLTQPGLTDAINEWFVSDDDTVDGIEFDQAELSALINYWFSQ